jgi:peptidyl-tRNA hydrolase
MNRSGKATRYWLEKEKLEKDRLLVIVDDLAIKFGALRLRGKGSPGTHNGLKDIDQMTGGGNYARLRIGIGADFPKGSKLILYSDVGAKKSQRTSLRFWRKLQKQPSLLAQLASIRR